MWPFTRRASKDELLGLKAVTVNGMRFKIKKINPLIDFPADKVPQIFTDHFSRRPPPKEEKVPTIPDVKKAQQDMYAVIEAGVVEPKLSPLGKDGITVEDLFRDPTMGPRLYIEIMAHALNAYSGIRGVFFCRAIKFSFWTRWLKDMGVARQKSRTAPVPSL